MLLTEIWGKDRNKWRLGRFCNDGVRLSRGFIFRYQ